VCNPTAVKAVEELHARSKGYSTSLRERGPLQLNSINMLKRGGVKSRERARAAGI
jgi:hypothetical protein